MKLSEAIREVQGLLTTLEDLHREHGDLPVKVWSDEGVSSGIPSASVEPHAYLDDGTRGPCVYIDNN